MPRKAKKAEGLDPKKLCVGGRSYNRHHFDHERGRRENILCFRCRARMGCSLCCGAMADLICLNCDDWATKVALERHGPMIRPEARGEIGTLLRMLYEGKISPAEAIELYKVNFVMDITDAAATYSTKKFHLKILETKGGENNGESRSKETGSSG